MGIMVYSFIIGNAGFCPSTVWLPDQRPNQEPIGASIGKSQESPNTRISPAKMFRNSHSPRIPLTHCTSKMGCLCFSRVLSCGYPIPTRDLQEWPSCSVAPLQHRQTPLSSLLKFIGCRALKMQELNTKLPRPSWPNISGLTFRV